MVSYLKASALLSMVLPAISASNTSAHKIPNPNDLDLGKSRESKHHQKHLRTNSGVGLASLSDDPVKTIQSEECAPLVRELANSLEGILRYPDEQIIEFSCNAIQREETLAVMAKMGNDMAQEKDPCIKAVEEVDTATDFQSTFSSKEACTVGFRALLDVARDHQDIGEVRVGAATLTTALLGLTARTALFIFQQYQALPDDYERPPRDSF
mmetsp:Transcript_14668/g.23787  ORF Transcript_14668/g.23787 Transcript_14668/m.23787 type:complete len:211 (+) Transcript_14668:175-807(+)